MREGELIEREEMIDGPTPLTPQEETFCEAYADPESTTYGKATKSAEAAGYVEPHNAAWKLRRRPRIIARLEEFQEAARAALGKVMSDLEHTRQRALEKGDLAVAARCSELQGKHLGAFFERSMIGLDVTARRELSESERLECDRLARLALADTLGLAPADVGVEPRALPPAPEPAAKQVPSAADAAERK